MRILVATSNPHKLQEIEAVFHRQQAMAMEALSTLRSLTKANQEDGLPAFEFLSLADLPTPIAEPQEDQPTFEGNAQLKARYYAKASGVPTIADDSGLEVDALDGAPGVHSARYSGLNGQRSVVDPANNALLLKNLLGVEPKKRTARFVCAMAMALPAAGDDGVMMTVRGSVEGLIIPDGQPQVGHNGFGYDPLFFLPHLNKTMAQLTPSEKNALSHRGQATRLLWKKLPDIFDAQSS